MTNKFTVELFDTKNTSTPQIDLEATNLHDAIKEVLEQTYWDFRKAHICIDGDNWYEFDKNGKFLACSLPILNHII